MASSYGKQHGGSSKELNTELSSDSEIPILGIYPKELTADSNGYLHTDDQSSITHYSPKVETSKCLSTDEWANKMQFLCTAESVFHLIIHQKE